MCLGKTQQNSEPVFHLIIFPLILLFAFDLCVQSLFISHPAYFKVHNFPLVYFFPSCQPHIFSMLFCVLLTAHYLSLFCLLSTPQPSTGEKETREGWVKIDTIAADKSFSKVEPSSPHQYQPNRYNRINIKTRSFAPLTRNG